MTDLLHGGTQNWVIGTSGPVGSFSSGMVPFPYQGFGMDLLYDLTLCYFTVINDALLIFNNPMIVQIINILTSTLNLIIESFKTCFFRSRNDNVNWEI